jgi:hypothetical protein
VTTLANKLGRLVGTLHFLIPRCAALLGFVLWGTRALMDNVSAQEHAHARLRKPDVGGL